MGTPRKHILTSHITWLLGIHFCGVHEFKPDICVLWSWQILKVYLLKWQYVKPLQDLDRNCSVALYHKRNFCKTVQLILRNLLKKLFNIILDLDSFKSPAVSFERHTIRSYKELLKIPYDVIAGHRRPDNALWVGHEWYLVIVWERQCFLQEFEKWVCICSIHFTLLKHGEVRLIPIAWADKFQWIQDLFIGGIFL